MTNAYFSKKQSVLFKEVINLFLTDQDERSDIVVYLIGDERYAVTATCIGHEPPNFDDVICFGEVGRCVASGHLCNHLTGIEQPLAVPYDRLFSLTATHLGLADLLEAERLAMEIAEEAKTTTPRP